MTALLQYDISVVGTDAVRRAFGTVERYAEQHKRKLDAMFSGRSGGARSRRSTAARAQLGMGSSAASAVATERGANAELAAAQRLSRQRERLADREFQKKAAHVRKLARIEVAAHHRVAQEAERTRKREAQNVASRRKRTTGQVVRGAAGTVGAIGATAAGAFGLTGTAMLASGAHNQIQEERTASRLAVMSGKPNAKGTVLNWARSSAKDSEFSPTQFMAAGDAYQSKTGDLMGSGLKMLPKLADIATATSSNLEDVTAAAGAVRNTLDRSGLKGKQLESKTLEVMRALAAQASSGEIELRDLANGTVNRITASSGGQTGNVIDNIKFAGQLAQLAPAGGATSPEEAGTAVSRIQAGFLKHEKEIKKAGIDVFTDKSKTKMRSTKEMLTQGIESGAINLQTADKWFGAEALKAIRPLVEANAGGDKGGKKLLSKFGGELTAEQIRKRKEARLKDPDVVIAKSFEKLNQAIGQELVPVLIELVPKLKEMIPEVAKATRAFATVVETFAENPMAGIGLIIAAAIAKEIAAAQIASAFGNVATAATGASTTLGAVKGAAGALAPALVTAAMLAAAVAVAADYLDQKVKKKQGEQEAARMNKSGADRVAAARAELKKTGKLSDETVADLQLLRSKSLKRGKERSAVLNEGFFDVTGRAFGGLANQLTLGYTDFDSLGDAYKTATRGAGGLETANEVDRIRHEAIMRGGVTEKQATAMKKEVQVDGGVELKGAAGKLASAAEKMNTAATKLAAVSPNRGPTPSTVR